MNQQQPTWEVTLDKSDFLEAIGFVRTRAGLRYKGPKLEPDVLILSCPEGLSFRTSYLAVDVPAEGAWPSPIAVNGPVFRRIAPKLSGPTISMRYTSGELELNSTRLTAREI